MKRLVARGKIWSSVVAAGLGCGLVWTGVDLARAANPQAAAYLKLLQSGRVPAQNLGTILDLICGKGDGDDLRVVLDKALDPQAFPPAARAKAVASLADAMETRKVKPSGELAPIAALVKEEGSPDLQLAAIRAASVWHVPEVGAELRRIVGQAKANETLRQAALAGLVKLGGDENQKTILALTERGRPMAERYRAVAALVAMDLDGAARRAAEVLADGTAADSPAVLVEAFLTVKQGPERLAAALDKARPPKDAAKLALRAMYAFGHNDAALSQVLSDAAGVQADPPKPTADEIATLVREAAEKGSAERGEDVFRRTDVGCLKCHSVMRAGGAVGPELTPLGATSPPDYIITSILDPNAAIKEQYLTRLFETSDGRIVTGIVVDRNAERVRLKDANNREITLPVAEIEEETTGKSLMPVGVTKFLTHEEVLDLVKFLSELGKPGPYGPRPTPTIQRWRVARMLPDELAGDNADPEALRTFLQEERPEAWGSAYAKVNGEMPVRELSEGKAASPAAYLLQGEIDVTESGTLGFRVKGPSGTLVWLDGSPLGARTEFVTDTPLSIGKHRLALRVPAKSDTAVVVEVFAPEGGAAKFAVVGGL